MASKQPFKLLNITQKLTTWGIRINKFFKHRVLSKRKNALLIGGENTQFRQLLTTKLAKTWEVYHINEKQPIISMLDSISKESNSSKSQSNKGEKVEVIKNIIQQTVKQSPSNQMNSRPIMSLQNHSLLQQQLKGRQYDAVIVLPQSIAKMNQQYPEIDDQRIVTSFIPQFQQKVIKNIIAYRLANKYLTTSGSFILSCSENDFVKQAHKKIEKQKNQKEKENVLQQKKEELKVPKLPASKNIIDNSICYLGIVVGDRDYTDLNSWTLVGLSQEVSAQDLDFSTQYYRNWADGQHLPMPGSFALFKRSKNDSKKCEYVQYL